MAGFSIPEPNFTVTDEQREEFAAMGRKTFPDRATFMREAADSLDTLASALDPTQQNPLPQIDRSPSPYWKNPAAPVEPMTKALLLDKAKEAVADRGLNYGKPEDNFERIALRWRIHLLNRFKMVVPIDATSVALMMVDMKAARLENDPSHLDSWVDMAGYTACGAEIATKR